ncbi:MAG: nicotinate-nucleotide--dimethylbenzimidazole phosphoribosyltransferase [Ilumatobacteraceae bacterium]
MTARLRALLADLGAFDAESAGAVRLRASDILRPPGAMQRLDDLAVHIAGWQATSAPRVEAPSVIVFAADHGVVAAGVSAYPGEVTAAMLAAVGAGRATINAFARAVGATVSVHDVGVSRPTGDIRVEPALTAARFDEIVDLAIDAVDEAVGSGADLLVLGELGIGNTTAAAAVAAAMLGGGATRWVGRGSGVDDDGLVRKIQAVADAVSRVAHVADPLDLLREVGGAELVAMAAACVQARRRRVPVVIDGYIATAAVLALHVAVPGALDHCIAGHRSSEPGHDLLLTHLGMTPLLDLGLRLGEGSGALAAVPLVRMACAGVVEVPTFAEWFGA